MSQGLKLIMACSADGFLCRGPDDDMRWTGKEDKRLFHALTMTGGVLGAGRKTFEMLPKLPERTLVCLSTQDIHADRGMRFDRHGRGWPQMSLGMFAHRYPGAWLLGGPTVACEALDVRLVDEVHLFHSTKVQLGGGVGIVETVLDRVDRYMQSTGIVRFDTLHLYSWRRT